MDNPGRQLGDGAAGKVTQHRVWWQRQEPGRGHPEGCLADAVPVDGTFYSAEEGSKTEGKNLSSKVGLKAKMLWVRGMK